MLDATSSFNLIGDPGSTGGLVHGVNGNIVGDGNGNPLDITTILDTELKDNGGATFTHNLVSGSSENACIRRRSEHKDDVWAWDFVHDRTASESPLKWLSIVDEYTRECLCLKVARSITSEDVIDTLAENPAPTIVEEVHLVFDTELEQQFLSSCDDWQFPIFSGSYSIFLPKIGPIPSRNVKLCGYVDLRNHKPALEQCYGIDRVRHCEHRLRKCRMRSGID